MKDIHEWLVEIGVQPPANHAPAQVVTYHESCHLAHGQKITAQPRQLLNLIPNLKLVELPESTWCCGSAGIYNIVQPEMANQLLDRKLKHIQSTGAQHRGQRQPGLPAAAHQRRQAEGLEPAGRAPGDAAGRSLSAGEVTKVSRWRWRGAPHTGGCCRRAWGLGRARAP